VEELRRALRGSERRFDAIVGSLIDRPDGPGPAHDAHRISVRHSPAALLAIVDRTLKKAPKLSVCTAMCMRLDGGRVTLAVGGHPLAGRFGLGHLCEALTVVGGETAEGVIGGLARKLDEFQTGTYADDTAALVLRRVPADEYAPGSGIGTITMPARGE
jgi:hypothetical protein